METQFILCHVWSNKLQEYVQAGTLLYDSSYSEGNGFTGWMYHEDYLSSGHGELDPKHLNRKLLRGDYSVPITGGYLPHFFQQFLPGEFAEQLLSDAKGNWNQISQFEKLAIVTNIYGDFHAISLSNHQPQIQNDIDDIEQLAEVAELLNTYIIERDKSAINGTVIAAISNLSGQRPKIDFYDNENKKRYIVKLNNTPYFNDAKVSSFISELQNLSGITTAVSEVRTSSKGQSLLFQENFSNIKDEDMIIKKFNQVSFKVLVSDFKDSTFRKRLTYKDVAHAIREYSSSPEEDIQELYKRAYFSASVNHTNNGLDNISMIDIGTNEWRLSPSFNNLPTPYNNSDFAIAFSENMVARNLFNLDDTFAIKLADEMGFDSTQALEIKHNIDNVIANSNEIANKHKLSSDDIKSLVTAMPEAMLEQQTQQAQEAQKNNQIQRPSSGMSNY